MYSLGGDVALLPYATFLPLDMRIFCPFLSGV